MTYCRIHSQSINEFVHKFIDFDEKTANPNDFIIVDSNEKLLRQD